MKNIHHNLHNNKKQTSTPLNRATHPDNNVYLSNLEQDSWNDIHATYIENAMLWRNIAIIAIIALVIVALYAIYTVNQDKHKVIVFEKDNLDNITTLGLATKTMNIDNKIIAHQLTLFLSALREVPIANDLKRRNINLAHSMIEAKTKAVIDKMLIAQYVKAHNNLITIIVHKIKPISNSNSWEIAWQENMLDQTGNIIETSNWSSSVSFSQTNQLSTELQILNPAGILINYFSPMQDINN